MTEIAYKLLHPGDGYYKDSPDDPMFYICCPVCATKVCKVGDGSRVESVCKKCNLHLGVKVEGLNVTVTYDEEDAIPISIAARRNRHRVAPGTIIPS